jgi:hypothetical protein
MSSLRWVGAVSLLLILLIVLAGCGQRIPGKSNATSTSATPLWGGQGSKTAPNSSWHPGSTPTNPTATPTTPGAVVAATVIPLTTATVTPGTTYRNPPPSANASLNYTVIYDRSLPFTWNTTAVSYELTTPPLIIEYTLTVVNITRTRKGIDPTSGADITVTSTYPDPSARFEVTVLDPDTLKIIVQDGYGGQYDIAYSKELRVLRPGKYQIQMSGNRVTAQVRFTVPKGNSGT